jgi:hypothetical protein
MKLTFQYKTKEIKMPTKIVTVDQLRTQTMLEEDKENFQHFTQIIKEN